LAAGIDNRSNKQYRVALLLSDGKQKGMIHDHLESSNNVNMSVRTKGRAPQKAQDSGVTSRPRVKHTRT
jgi:hypothetical protein